MTIRRFAGHAISVATVSVCMFPVTAAAQNVDLNYDELSSLEEPIAFEMGEVTVALTGLIDVPVVANFEDDGGRPDVEAGFIGNFQISAQTQLPNRWRLGAAYFGQYATDANVAIANPDEYTDNVAGFIGTSFGTVLGGNVSGQVELQTRRQQGAGNSILVFDTFYGTLDQWGGAYVGRFGPVVLTGAVDEHGDFEVGGFFQRPIGRKDYRIAFRLADSHFVSNDGTTRFDTKGVMAVGEFVYGSSRFDLGLGYERLESSLVDANRWFASAGAATKIGPLRLSAEGHYGKASGDSEKSAALGASFDVARGLSLNLGLNYQEARIDAGPVNLVSTDALQGVVSTRFSF